MKLGEKILKLRKKKGLSQEELGERLDVTRQTISNWELGETSPNPEQLKKLSKELNISIDELLDNDVQSVLIEKVSNTEKLAGLILKIIKIVLIVIPVLVVLFILLLFLLRIDTSDKGRRIDESIHCKLYGEEHSFSISYYELTGRPMALGGDPYFSDILDLGKYNDAHQIFNVINDYVKKNGGECHMVESKDLNNIVDVSVKEGSLSPSGLTLLLKLREDYDITYGEPFWIEKYNNKTSSFERMEVNEENNCAFILPAYHLEYKKEREIKQDWSCMYGNLKKGLYRIVKNVHYESDTPISEDDNYYIWAEFEIE